MRRWARILGAACTAQEGDGTNPRALGTSRGLPGRDAAPPALDLAPMAALTDADWLARYQPWRRHAEAGFWVAVLTVQSVFNAIVTGIDLRRFDPEFPRWHPFVWEFTSVLVVGALIPLVLAFERRFPLRWGLIRRHLPLHLLGAAVYCLLHVLGMVALRKLFYGALGEDYAVRSWQAMFFYEFLKDVRTYLLVLVAGWSYRLLLLRLQGEARVLDTPDVPVAGAPATAAEPAAPPPAAPARPERFLVRKLRKEFLIAAADIDWLQAQGNYVGLHVQGHDYLLRSTLSEFLAQLDPSRFARVHRSWAVNLDRIAQIEPTDGGDARLVMKDGAVVPCSRTYREALGR